VLVPLVFLSPQPLDHARGGANIESLIVATESFRAGLVQQDEIREGGSLPVGCAASSKKLRMTTGCPRRRRSSNSRGIRILPVNSRGIGDEERWKVRESPESCGARRDTGAFIKFRWSVKSGVPRQKPIGLLRIQAGPARRDNHWAIRDSWRDVRLPGPYLPALCAPASREK